MNDTVSDFPRFTWLYWLVAFTFLWGIVLVPWGASLFLGWSEWATLLAYPLICGGAAFHLLRTKQPGRIARLGT